MISVKLVEKGKGTGRGLRLARRVRRTSLETRER